MGAIVVVIRAYKFEQDQLKRLQSNSEVTTSSKSKCRLDKRRESKSTSQLPPPHPRRPSQIRKQIEIKIDGDTPRGSIGSNHGRRSTVMSSNAMSYSNGLSTQLALEALDSQFDFNRKMSAQSVGSLSPNSKKLSVLSPSHRKYSDIMPPTRPPSLGMKRVLSADQQAKRPLPPTPTGKDSTYVD